MDRFEAQQILMLDAEHLRRQIASYQRATALVAALTDKIVACRRSLVSDNHENTDRQHRSAATLIAAAIRDAGATVAFAIQTASPCQHELSAESQLLNIEAAAAYLGRSVRTLRKIIERSRKRMAGVAVQGEVIRFAQDGPGAEILFRREWLDEFVGKTTANPESEPTIAETIQRAHRPKASQSLVEGKHINFDYLD